MFGSQRSEIISLISKVCASVSNRRRTNECHRFFSFFLFLSCVGWWCADVGSVEWHFWPFFLFLWCFFDIVFCNNQTPKLLASRAVAFTRARTLSFVQSFETIQNKQNPWWMHYYSWRCVRHWHKWFVCARHKSKRQSPPISLLSMMTFHMAILMNIVRSVWLELATFSINDSFDEMNQATDAGIRFCVSEIFIDSEIWRRMMMMMSNSSETSF